MTIACQDLHTETESSSADLLEDFAVSAPLHRRRLGLVDSNDVGKFWHEIRHTRGVAAVGEKGGGAEAH